MRMQPSISVSVLAMFLGTAQAAEEPAHDEHEHAEMDRMTVTAVPLGQSASDIPLPISILSGDSLYLKNNGGALGEVLSEELGVTGTYFGPGSSRPVIRGQQGPRVRVLENRIGSLDVSDVSPDHAVSIEPLFAEQIEIIRGPGTLVYGSGAEGGVVNVVTNRIPKTLPESAVSATVEARGDTAADEETLAGVADGRFGNLAWHLDGVTRDTDDVDIDGFATRTSIRTEEEEEGEPVEEEKGTLANSATNTDAWSGGLSWVGERGFFGAAYSSYEADYGLPGPGEHGHGEEEEEEGEGEGGAKIDLDQDRFDFAGEWRAAEGWLESLRLEGSYNDYQHNEIEPSGEIGTRFDNDAFEGRTELAHRTGEWRGVVGLQFLDRDFKALGEEAFVPPTDSRSWGYYLLQERNYGATKFTVSGRFETMEHDPDAGGPDYDDDAVSASLGWVFGLGGDYSSSLTLSYTERHPTSEELYSDGPHLATAQFEIGDPDLDIEQNKSIDLGIRKAGGDWHWSVSAFYKASGDHIYQQRTGAEEDDLPVAVYAQDDAIFYGYEAELFLPVWRLGPGDFETRLWSDYVRGKLDDARGRNDNLPRIPAQRAGLGLTWLGNRWRAGVDVIKHLGQKHTADFELETGNYTLVNANLMFDLAPKWGDAKFFLRGTNLLDERGRRHESYLKDFAPIPGMSLHAGFRVGFGAGR
ncbi:MAG: TonB-dependent receptor [Gammaproteobacteria bacterium]